MPRDGATIRILCLALMLLGFDPRAGAQASNETVLLVVANKTTPTAQDAAKQALFQSWGYNVVLIEATESQARFDSAATTADVAYISEEITSTDLGTKLTGASIGVVDDEDALSDELGISSSFGLYTSDLIDVTDNSHHVTAPFPVGPLVIASPAQPLHTVAGTIAAGARVLAEEPATANGTLVIIEAGGLLTSPPGGTAAGRRAYLPWGGGGFDINALNADGMLLMRRSLEWGAAGRISGTVFEDVNYGGGAGRSQTASAGIGQANADVELYDSNGVYIIGTNTDASGNYNFTGLSAGTYYVRVVTDSVRSSRTGWSTACRPVLTYRTDASSGAAVAVTDFVGGTTPSATDPGKGSAGAAFNTGTLAFTAVLTGTVQAVTQCVVDSASITGVDFGFNYNTVVNTNNSGQGSFRQVMTNANTLGGDASLAQSGLVAAKENAVFMISNGTAAPGLRAANNYFSGGVATVALDSALPVISTPLILSAQLQPGFGTTPVIQLDGTAAGAGVDGFSLSGSSDASVIRGFIIKRCSRDGVLIQAGADSITIAGCWIGTDGTNTPTMRNTDDGIEIFGAYATIGGVGAYDRNVVNQNGDEGINITGAAATGNVIIGNFIGLEPNGSSDSGNADVGIAILPGATANRIGGVTVAERNVISRNKEGIEINTADNAVLGNFIGTDSTGTLNRGNRSDDGVELQSVNALRNRIGDTLTGAGNLIAFNALNGVTVAGGNRNSVLGNRIHSNTLRGIDLANNGVTPNDSADGDGGANRLQNYPVLDSAITNGVDTVYVYGMLNSFVNANFLVELYADSVADPTSHGEGATYLGKTWVTTNGLGKTTFSAALPALVPVGRVISTTATDTLGNTSEFSDTTRVRWPATSLSVAVSNSTFAFGVQAPNTWLPAQSSVITNDGTLTENLVGQISQLTDGTNNWAISATTNGADQIRAQWSTTSAAGPWTGISAYASNFTIATGVAPSGSVTFWLRIQTPTATTSFQPYASTLTVTAQ